MVLQSLYHIVSSWTAGDAAVSQSAYRQHGTTVDKMRVLPHQQLQLTDTAFGIAVSCTAMTPQKSKESVLELTIEDGVYNWIQST